MAIKKVRVQIDGTWVELTFNAVSGKYEGTIAAPNITSYNVNAGHYDPVTVEAEDLASNITTVNDSDPALGDDLRLFVKEITKPTITYTAPASDAHLASNTPQIKFQLRDEVNGSGIKISTLQLKIDGGSAITNTSPGMAVTAVSGGYDVTYTPQTALDDGSHTVTVDIEDNDGNKANQATRSFVVDTVPPELNVTVPAEPTSYHNTTSLTVIGTTNDAHSSPVTVTVKLNTGAAELVTVDGSGNFSKSLTLIEGTNTVTVTSTDKASKTSTVIRTVIVDTASPVVMSISIVPNPVDVGQNYLVSVEVND